MGQLAFVIPPYCTAPLRPWARVLLRGENLTWQEAEDDQPVVGTVLAVREETVHVLVDQTSYSRTCHASAVEQLPPTMDNWLPLHLGTQEARVYDICLTTGEFIAECWCKGSFFLELAPPYRRIPRLLVVAWRPADEYSGN